MLKGKPHIAFYVYLLSGGGAERIIVNLMQDFVKKGLKVDLVLNKLAGDYLTQVPSEVRIVNLDAPLPFRHGIPKLASYLKKEQPLALLSTVHPNIEVALLAKVIAFSSTRIVIREASTLSLSAPFAKDKTRWSPILAKLFYRWANGIVAVSQGVAKDLANLTGLSQSRIQVIYNPTVTADLLKKSQEYLDHPWFKKGEPPVIIGVGRLEPQKNFSILIQAFSQVRQKYYCRLVILGQGSEQQKLNNLAVELGLENDVAMLGFVQNPYAYMAKASVFVLSSFVEGLPNVLIEAMALGTPVISTNCQSGPAEILDYGKYGTLIPVGDSKLMAEAILNVLSGSVKLVDSDWLNQFTLEKVAQKYLDVLGISSI